MRCVLFLLVSALSLFGTGKQAAGQATGRVSGNFSGITFKEFVQRVESTTDYHFYYDEKAVDSLRVNLSSAEGTLPELLQQLFQNSIFHFAIDAQHRVLITKQVAIQTALPANFFDRVKRSLDSTARPEIAFLEAGVTEKPKRIAENKIFEIGSKTASSGKGTATVAGYVRNNKTGEPIMGAAVFIDTPTVSVLTDQYGYYSLTLPKGNHVLHASSVGMNDMAYQVLVYTDGKLNIELQDYIPSLKEVVVVSERHSNVRETQMGIERLSIQTIKQVPVVFGEADVLRVVLTLPGVTSVGEASTGFNVRGGAADQNLILFSDATIYNPSHLFGFFSAFNPDVVKGVELYKSGIPEKYGVRLSSVLDVTTREGNSKKISGVGGIGLLTSKLMVEGPLVKGKTTFIVGGRTTYSNWLLKKVPNEAYKNSKASFYDVDLHIAHAINAKNNLYLTGYFSNDEFNLRSDTAYAYGNKNANLKWKHIFNNKFYSVFTGGYDHYQYSITGSKGSVKGYQLAFAINQAHFRADFNLAPGNKHLFNFGLNAIDYHLHPGSFTPAGQQSLVVPDLLPAERGLESAIYAGDRITVTPKLSINAGLRYSLFNYLGPQTVYKYAPDIPKEPTTIQDTAFYNSGKLIKTYHGPEYRFTARYSFSEVASVKASVNSLRQYIHTLSNTTAVSPTDIWKLSDPNIQPQQGYQVSIGYYRNFKSNTIETSLEVYYKKLRHYLDYKSGATLLMNHHIETDVINTRGKAYGAELLLRKTSGRVNGWISYAYSRTLLQIDDPVAGETINHGDYYPANFDKPHNVNFIGNYRFSHRFSMSVNVIYSTGRPITLPLAVFDLGGAQRLYYSERNQYRIPDYFRTDLSMNLEGNHKIKQLTHNSWSLGVYNITGRQNAYSVYFIQQGGAIKGYKLSIFGTLIPFVTYNFRF